MTKLQQKREFKLQLPRFCAGFLALIFVVISGSAAHAQVINARISVLSTSPARVKIEGRCAVGTTVWSFRNQYATVSSLGERIENFSLSDENGASIVAQKIAPGEYSAANPATRFSYEMKLEPPAQTSDAAYVSWLTTERGILLTGDLLPRQTNGSEKVTNSFLLSFILPATWGVAANETKQVDGQYQVADKDQAVFLVGPELRQRRERIGQMEFTYVTAGNWSFTDEEVSSMAASILKDHAGVFGGQARQSAMMILIPFPSSVGADRWSAETRGGTVTLLSGQTPSRTAALAQLSVPLTHELFHLWVPNGLALDGDYDWFYEGFTLYQAIRAGMRLQLLTFQDYLTAMSRAFDAYSSISGRDQYSLVEASKQRWRSPGGLVYHKGLLIAFLYDLTLRRQTKNSRSLDDVYRDLFRRHRSSMMRVDGNDAAINILKNQNGMQEFVRQYIENASTVELRSAVTPFGLELSRGVRTHLTVSDSLSSAQRDLLRKFGYNAETQRRR